MRVRIAREFDFDAAHWLPNVHSEHKCRRMHGHTYRVVIVLEGVPDERGMVADYDEIAAAWEPVHTAIDHRLLNEIEGLENPTTEVLAPWIMLRLSSALPGVVLVKLYESSTTWCEVAIARHGLTLTEVER